MTLLGIITNNSIASEEARNKSGITAYTEVTADINSTETANNYLEISDKIIEIVGVYASDGQKQRMMAFLQQEI